MNAWDIANLLPCLAIFYLCMCRASVMNGHTQEWVKLLCGLTAGYAVFSAVGFEGSVKPFLGFLRGYHATPLSTAFDYVVAGIMAARYPAWREGVPKAYLK